MIERLESKIDALSLKEQMEAELSVAMNMLNEFMYRFTLAVKSKDPTVIDAVIADYKKWRGALSKNLQILIKTGEQIREDLEHVRT